VATTSYVQFNFLFRSPLAFLLPVSICLWGCSLVRLNLHPGVMPAQSFPSVLRFLSTSSLGRFSGAGTQRTAQVSAFLRGCFSSRVVLDSPCSFCLHNFSCTDFCCRCLISGFRASRARSGFGFLSSPLSFLVCVRSLPPESCSLPFRFWNPGFVFLALSSLRFRAREAQAFQPTRLFVLDFSQLSTLDFPVSSHGSAGLLGSYFPHSIRRQKLR
jgi:hypothetical protein